MTIRTKILFPFIVFLMVLTGAFIFLIILVGTIGADARKTVLTAEQINSISMRIGLLRQQTSLSLLSFQNTGNDKYLQIIERNSEETNRMLTELKPLIPDRTGKQLLSRFELTFESSILERIKILEAISSGNYADASRRFSIWEVKNDNNYAALLDFMNYNLHSLEQSRAVYDRMLRMIQVSGVIMAAMAAVLIALLYLYLRKVITLPVRELSKAADRMSEGDFVPEFHIKSSDELGSLALKLQAMALNLKKYHAGLKSEVAKKERELKKSREFEAQKDDFMSIASHELKTPVTSLKVYLHILNEEIEKSGHTAYRRHLVKIEDQVGKITRLITGLLDVTRLQAGKMPFEMVPLDLKSIVSERVDVYRKISRHHEFKLNVRLRRKVKGDADRISQVVDNLISNAVKYSPPGSRIIVSVKNGKTSATVGVRDFGIGIGRNHHEKIFNRFYRVTNRNQKTFPGLGIGLYLSRQIIKSHKGDLWVDSEKGKGAAFFFTIPYYHAKMEL
jgi:signal transduction histidine kinase